MGPGQQKPEESPDGSKPYNEWLVEDFLRAGMAVPHYIYEDEALLNTLRVWRERIARGENPFDPETDPHGKQ
jgi:hypothetical protein